MKIILVCIFIICFIQTKELENGNNLLDDEENSLIEDFTFLKALGLIANFMANIFTSYIGVSGSGIVYSIFIFFFDFKTKKAIPIYKMCNLISSIINIMYIFKKRK